MDALICWCQMEGIICRLSGCIFLSSVVLSNMGCLKDTFCENSIISLSVGTYACVTFTLTRASELVPLGLAIPWRWHTV